MFIFVLYLYLCVYLYLYLKPKLTFRIPDGSFSGALLFGEIPERSPPLSQHQAAMIKLETLDSPSLVENIIVPTTQWIPTSHVLKIIIDSLFDLLESESYDKLILCLGVTLMELSMYQFQSVYYVVF